MRTLTSYLALILLLACGAPGRLAADPSADPIGDARIAGYLESWIVHVQGLAAERVEVRVEAGRVTLRGHVDRPQQIAEILAFARNRPGVLDVIDELDVESAASSPPLASRDPGRWSSWSRWERAPAGRRTMRFPSGDLFAPPLADPRQPRFHTTLQRYEIDGQSFNVGSVGFGENFGLVRRPGLREGNGWQLGLSGAVQAIFDLDAPSNDLLNADYSVGMPLSLRRGAFSARLRYFHVSSHLGDEFLLNQATPLTRLDLSYEALEALLAWELGGLRIYGGGSRIVSTATPLERGRSQLGFEFRSHTLGRGSTRFVAAVDLQTWDETDRDVDLSVKTGLRFRNRALNSRSVMLLAEYYDGHTPHGQFFNVEVEYFGLGIAFGL